MSDTLRPVEMNEFYIRRIASGMAKYFWDAIFEKIFQILKSNEVTNSKDELKNAIKSGQVWYKDGAFRTSKRFSNAVSSILEKLGAKYKNNAYFINLHSLPSDYIYLINTVNSLALNKSYLIENYLAGLAPILNKLTVNDYIEANVENMVKQLQISIIKSAQEKKIPVIELDLVSPKIRIPKAKRINIEKYWEDQDNKALNIQKAILKAPNEADKIILKQQLFEHRKKTFENVPQIDVSISEIELDKESAKIAHDYVYNMNYWVKKWEVKNIVKMRQDVLDMVQKGVRVPELQTYFEKRWKVSKDKALFLADNESHLVGSVIKANEYQKMGCTQFKWGRSSSKEKRKSHEKLYNRIFDFDNPPVIDEKLDIKGFPRQIWNCKCHMLIVPPSLNGLFEQEEEVRNAKRNYFEHIKYKIRNSKQRNYNSWRYRRYGER